jgi:L-threonylcarbamoyladenylate synthase
MRKVSKNELKQALSVLRNQGVLVFPTETSYGIGCDARSDRAMRCLQKIKERAKGKTPPLLVSSFAMAERYGVFTPMLRKLAKKYWPGALTIVVKARMSPFSRGTDLAKLNRGGYRLSKEVIRDDGTIALRYTSHPIAQSLARRLGTPIVATSANKFGKPACYSIKEVENAFAQGLVPDFILDSGKLKKKKPSTIVTDVNGEIIVLRKGELKLW